MWTTWMYRIVNHWSDGVNSMAVVQEAGQVRARTAAEAHRKAKRVHPTYDTEGIHEHGRETTYTSLRVEEA